MNQQEEYTCEQVFQRLDDYVDRELRPEEVLKVEEHLKTCAMCASEYQFQGSMLQSLRTKIQHISVSPAFRDRIASVLQQTPPKDLD
jgi:anti-sigma factor RsiW